MDSLQDFAPEDTTGFIAIQSIRYIPIIHLTWSTSCVANDFYQAQEVWSAEGRRGRVPQPRMSLG